MAKIKLNLDKKTDQSYDIDVERGLFKKIAPKLKRLKIGQKFAIISDEKVGTLYGGKLKKHLRNNGIESELFTFKGGDKNKTFSTAQAIIDQMLEQKFARNDAIIALGGGVTGDVAGLIASIYMRGINFIHVPTTLLAMVDSSIGGKTGVNTTAGKNLIGTFYQPKAVLIDPSLLKTLPHEEFKNGLSEVVKYGAIADSELIETLEKNATNLNKNSGALLDKIISTCCKIKAGIVEKDEKEHGIRMVLNYGHTIGHAIERESNYNVSHGQAIAIGMILVNNITQKKGLTSAKDADRTNSLIKKLELLPKSNSTAQKSIVYKELWDAILSDKKVSHQKPTFIIIPKIGMAKTTQSITKKELQEAIQRYA